MPHVEVDHVLGVGPLHGDGEGFEGVEGEGHQAPHRVVDGPPQQARLDLELEQARVARVEPGEARRTGRQSLKCLQALVSGNGSGGRASRASEVFRSEQGEMCMRIELFVEPSQDEDY